MMLHMKILHLLLIATIIFATATGTNAQNKKWTLEECIDYAIAHNIEVEQSQNQINTLKVQRNTLKNSFLPDLNAGASQRFAFGRALNQNNTYEDSNIQSSSFSLSTELNLFSGFKTTASIAQNKLNMLAAEAYKELVENNLSLNIASAYFQILLDKENLRIAQEQIYLTNEQEERTQLLIKNGKVPQSQLYEVRAQLADDELTVTEAKNSLRLSLLHLSQLMELKADEEFDVTAADESIAVTDTLNAISIYNSSANCMPQIRQSYYILQSKTKEVKIARSGYYPAVSLGAGISTGYYYHGHGLSDTFKKQFDNNMQKSVYVTVSIPLFDRFATRNKVRTARIEENNSRLSLEKEKKELYKEIEKAYMDALVAFEKYESTSKAVAANREAHRYAQEKYAAGKSSVFEYNEIKMKLADALSKQSQAKYTYLLKEKILNFYACRSLTN